MSFPDAHPGLVIRHAYLWKREHDEGREDSEVDLLVEPSNPRFSIFDLVRVRGTRW